MLALAGIGALVAVATSDWFADDKLVHHQPVGKPVPAQTASAQLMPLTVIERNATNDARYQALEAQLSGVTRQLASLNDVMDSEARQPRHETEDDAYAQYPDMSEEELIEQELERHAQLVEAHHAEPIDARWAHTAHERYSGDFEKLSERLSGSGQSNGFNVRNLDCRSTSCVATLEWDSYADAAKGAEAIAFHGYEENCALSVVPFPPDDAAEARSYSHDVVFDCSNQVRG